VVRARKNRCSETKRQRLLERPIASYAAGAVTVLASAYRNPVNRYYFAGRINVVEQREETRPSRRSMGEQKRGMGCFVDGRKKTSDVEA